MLPSSADRFAMNLLHLRQRLLVRVRALPLFRQRTRQALGLVAVVVVEIVPRPAEFLRLGQRLLERSGMLQHLLDLLLAGLGFTTVGFTGVLSFHIDEQM